MPIFGNVPQGHWAGNRFVIPELPQQAQTPAPQAPTSSILNPAPAPITQPLSYENGYSLGADRGGTLSDGPRNTGTPGRTNSAALAYNAPTIGGVLGAASTIPGLGALGTAIGTGISTSRAKKDFLTDNISYGSALVNGLTFGLFGNDALSQGVDDYKNRTNTKLNEAALKAFAKTKTYSGPKGVVGRDDNKGRDNQHGGHHGGHKDPGNDTGDRGFY